MLTNEVEISVAPVAQAPDGESRILIFGPKGVLLDGSEDAPRLATLARVRALTPPDARYLHLACAGALRIYCPDPRQPFAPEERDGLRYMNVRSFQRMSESEGALLTAANHLWGWYRRNLYCGRCGKPLAPSTTERALDCAACGNQIFPMIAPAVIVAITKGDKLLLAQNLHYATLHHTLIAGY